VAKAQPGPTPSRITPAASASPSPYSSAGAASAAAAPLTGTWLADYAASTGRPALLTALGLSGLQRVTAEKLIEGVEISTGGGRLVVRYLTVVPFFQVVEEVPLDGSPITQSRRDLRPGSQTASLLGAEEDGRLVVSLAWPAPAPGTLLETYAVSGDELRATAQLWKGAAGRRDGVAPDAAATTVYRRAVSGRWAPKFRYPGGGPQPPPGPPDTARRAVLLAAAALASTAASPASAFPALPGVSRPAPPSPFAVTAPPPPLFPRRSLARPFAVILMRSPYDALADTIPAYPMSAFQAAFWELRADAWEPYIALRKGAGAAEPRPPQGDLTSAPYFDFISHAQWGALDAALEGAAAMLAAPVQAEEGWADGGEGGGDARPAGTEVSEDIAASAAAAPPGSSETPLPPPAGLRTLVAAAAGDRMLAMMKEGFQGATFVLPRPPTPSSTMGEVRAAVQALLDVFVANGWALSATATLDPDTAPDDRGGGLVITSLGPATLWGCAERAARGVAPNALDALAVGALFRAGGLGAILTRVEVGETGVTQGWVVGEGPVGVVVGQAPEGPPEEAEEEE